MSEKNFMWCENLSGAIHARKLICAGPIWRLDTEKPIAEAFYAVTCITLTFVTYILYSDFTIPNFWFATLA